MREHNQVLEGEGHKIPQSVPHNNILQEKRMDQGKTMWGTTHLLKLIRITNQPFKKIPSYIHTFGMKTPIL